MTPNRRESMDSSLSDGSNQLATDNGANGNGKGEYFNGEDFDEMINNVMEMEPTKRKSSVQSPEHGEEEGPAKMVDVTPDDDNTNSDLEKSMNSLNSDDISGDSDISDVEEQARKKKSSNKDFIPPPLINDDESTVDMRPPAPVNQSVSSYVEALNQQQNRKNRIVRLGVLFILVGVIVGVVLAIVMVSGGKDNGSGTPSGADGSGGVSVESNQISAKDSFVNGTTYPPSISPSAESVADVTDSPSMSPVEMVTPTSSPLSIQTPTLPPQLPTSSPEADSTTDAPVAAAVTDAPITPDPTLDVSEVKLIICFLKFAHF